MFSGAFEHSVDSKGRTVMPARIRAKLGETFVMTKGLEGCIWVFSEKRWPEVQEKLIPNGFLDSRGRKLERFFMGAATETAPDKQGRIAISQILMDHAGIKPGDSVWVVGLTDKVEIWEKSRWEEFNAGLDRIIAGLDTDGEDPQ